jgi:ATP-dependent Lhr-like helicase
LGWPEASGGHRPGRKAGALVVLLDGALALYVERGGKTVLGFGDLSGDQASPDADPAVLDAIAIELVAVLRRAAIAKLGIEKINGKPVVDTPVGAALRRAGFYSTPSGLRFRN